MIRRMIVTVGASALIAVAPTAGTAAERPATAPASAQLHQARAPYCYHPSNRVTVTTVDEIADDTWGTVYESAALWVPASPCHDVNVRRPHNAAGPAVGAPVCAMIQISFGPNVNGPWIDTCSAWQVGSYDATEGRPFVVRSAIRPVRVTVAS